VLAFFCGREPETYDCIFCDFGDNLGIVLGAYSIEKVVDKRGFEPPASSLRTSILSQDAVPQSLSFRSEVLRWPTWTTGKMAGATPLWPANFSKT